MFQPLSRTQRAWSICILLVAILTACLVWQTRPSKQSVRPAGDWREPSASAFEVNSEPADPLPHQEQLAGEQARTYLERTKEGQSLMQAVTAERFGLKSEECDPISGESGAGYLGMSHDQNLNAWFDETGATIRPTVSKEDQAQAWQLGLRLKAYGYGSQMQAAPPIVAHTVKGTRIEYERTADFGMQISDYGLMKSNLSLNPHSAIRTPQLVEWYENRSEGIEQGFTINERPRRSSEVAANEPLRVSLRATGDLRASVKDKGQRIELVDAKGNGALSYSKLTAVDADSQQLEARMEASADGREITLVVEDQDAAYPIVIDPIVATSQTNPSLNAGGTSVEAGALFGYAVAIDDIRNTALIGAPRDDAFDAVDVGLLFVFRRQGATWSLSTTSTSIKGNRVSGLCGYSVAWSFNKYIYGCPGVGGNTGEAYVLEVNAGGNQLREIIPAAFRSAGDFYGASVAISVASSGPHILVGSPNHDGNGGSPADVGIVHNFIIDSSNNITTVSFLGGDSISGGFGSSVAIDGNDIIAGAPNGATRYARTFRLDDSGIAQFESTLVPGSGSVGDRFGAFVDISGDTVVISASADDQKGENAGAAYVFVRDGSGDWSQQQKLTGSDTKAGDRFGYFAAAIQGSTIIIGAYLHETSVPNNKGAAYIFTRSGNLWSEQSRMTSGGAGNSYGSSVDISANTVIVGAAGTTVAGASDAGAVFIYRIDCIPVSEAYATPFNSAVCPGGSATISVGWSSYSIEKGNPDRFQWRKNGQDIPGATSRAYTINNAGASDEASYDVILYNSCSTLTARATTLRLQTFSLDPTSQNSSASGSDGLFSVTSTGTCPYTAVPSASWIKITSNGSGTAPKNVGFHIDPNTSSSQRTGTITIGDKVFTVTQDGLNCSYAIAPTSQGFTAPGGTNTVNVTAAAGCAWVAQSNSPFITINSGSSGNGNGAVNYSVAANTGSARSGTISVAGQTFTVNQAAPMWEPVVLTTDQVELKTWTLSGRTYAYVKLLFPNAGYRVPNWGQPINAGSNVSADALVEKLNGPSVLAVTTTAQIYDLGPLTNGNYTFTFRNSGTAVKSLAFTVSSTVPPPNPIDNAREFVRWQYRDFLNREADQAGEDFWTDNITKCSDPARRPAGQTEAQCTTRQRETTSGAFFQSPEFQYTGYFVYRMYQGALGRRPKLSEFTPDALFVGNGIIVNGQLSAAKVNQNKAAFAAQFVNCIDPARYRCSEFKTIYDGLSNQQYVDRLFLTSGVNASASDRTALVNGLNGGTETRATVLQKVVDGINVIAEGNQQFTTTYGQTFYNNEFNRAFVQLEYFGYMKRDPDDGGYAFWLAKLNLFGGNFVNAEMVLAFISSPEYRARFGQP